MRRVFEATASDGTVFKRSSDTRVYTHCVATWRDGRVVVDRSGYVLRPPQPAGWDRQTQWASRLDLAQKAAGREKANGLRVEILEAREVTKPRAKIALPWWEESWS